MFDRLAQDARFALRLSRRSPWFAATALATLALGIGACTTVFTVVDHVLFRSPPYFDGDRLVQVIGLDGPRGGGGNILNAHLIRGWQAQGVFERLEGYGPQQFDVAGDGEPERIFGYTVTTGLFSMLGIAPERGRLFGPGDGRPGDERVAILGHGVWLRRFGGSADAVGATILLNNDPHRIVGIMPKHFLSRDDAILVPLDLAGHDGDPAFGNFIGLGRLHTGVSADTAQARTDALAAALNERDPQVRPRSWYLRVRPWRIVYLSDMARDALLILLGAVGFVLLIACANVANLLLARGVVREREMAVRSALGASRARLIRQGLTESVLLSVGGGALGVGLAYAGIRAAVAALPTMPFIDIGGVDLGIDGRILAFASALSCLTTVAAGLAPAVGASGPNLDSGLRGSASGSGSSSRQMSGGLVLAEVAFSIVLLVGSALMVRTFLRLNALEPGFDPSDVLTAAISLPSDRYPTPAARQEFFDSLSSTVSRLPGVSGVAMADGLPPIEHDINFGTVEGDDTPIRRAEPDRMSGGLVVTPQFFDVLKIPFVEGRTFARREPGDAAIINAALASRLWPGASAVGRRIRVYEQAPWLTVVGVVANMEMRLNISNERTPLQIYTPLDVVAADVQPLPPARARRAFVSRRIMVRTGDPAMIVPAFKREVWALDKTLPVQQIELLQDVWKQTFAPQLLVVLLMSLFSAVAAALAAAGLFAVVSHVVARRTREIGIRVALGATRRDIFRLVMTRVMALVLIGVALGLGGAAALSRTLTALLFEVSPYDTVSFVAVSAGLLVVALVACWLPTRRAITVDPTTALRTE
jgi:putative ABC transport system permease protein